MPNRTKRVLIVSSLLLLILLVALAVVAWASRDRAQSVEDPHSGSVTTASDAEPSTPSSAPNVQTSNAVKIVVDQDGLYQVTADQLLKAGFDLAAGDPTRLSLTVAGQPVTFVLDEDGPRARLTFYGQSRQSRYGRDNIYWLRWLPEGGTTGGPVTARAVETAQGKAMTSFDDLVIIEESLNYLSQIPHGTDHWLWQSIFAPDSFAVPLELPAWAGGDAVIRVSLWGNTEDQGSVDHHILLRLNGQQVADESWDGKGWRTIEAPLPGAALKEMGNELVIESPGDTGAVVDVVYLDRVEVSYPRRLKADSGRLRFNAPAGAVVTVAGFGDQDVLLWDVTEPRAAQPLRGYELDGGVLRFQDGVSGEQRRYVAALPDARLTPKAVEPHNGRDLRDNPEGADYIAIVAPGFEEPLQPLVERRRSQGLRVTVATIDDVYDTFSEGLLDPAAIRDYMLYARQHWPGPAPRFLLLVGDASYDYQGFLPDSTPNYVPTYLLTTHFVGETSSDNWFVSLDDEDDRPDMAVGRIPAQTPEQVAVVVAKTLVYEQEADATGWTGRALFVADNKQSSFQIISDDLASQFLPASYEVEKVYLGQVEDPNGQILESLRQGVGLVTYFGHGSMNVWAQEKIFQTDDVSSLDNAPALPFMMTMTCLVGYFHHPQATSMGEELLFKEDGGVVAALVPTSESLASDQRELAESVYTHLFGDAPTIGEAIMLAKQDLSSERAIMQDLIETFTLLGDPALALRLPN